MRKIALVTVTSATAALCLSAACGKTETNTVTNTVYVTVTAGGNGGTGGGTAGTGGAPGTGVVGDSCKLGSECASDLCLNEENTGWGTGYCAQFCNGFVTCPDGTMCVSGGAALGQICLTSCDASGTGSECHSPQTCYDLGDGVTGVCIGGCATASDCPVMGNCDTTNGVCSCTDNTGCPTLGNCEPGGYCAVPEICDNQKDDDGDQLTDCEDFQDCGTACAAQYTAACTAAVAAQATQSGDTTGGTSLFAGSCTGGNGALENIFTYTPTAADVTVHITLASPDTDQGIYVRSDCADGATELACQDAAVAGGIEDMYLPVTSTDPLTIFVDGYEGAASAGAYTLGVSELHSLTESEPNDAFGTADVVAPGSIVTAEINPANENDWFSVTVPANSTLHATIAETVPGDCGIFGMIDSTLEILGTDHVTVLDSQDPTGSGVYCQVGSASNLAAGTYFVHVSAPVDWSSTFPYYLVIEVQ